MINAKSQLSDARRFLKPLEFLPVNVSENLEGVDELRDFCGTCGEKGRGIREVFMRNHYQDEIGVFDKRFGVLIGDVTYFDSLDYDLTFEDGSSGNFNYCDLERVVVFS